MVSGQRIKETRNRIGLSQTELADLLFMGQGALSNCETGIRNLSLKKCYMLIKLAKIAGIDISIEYLRPNE